MGLQRVLKKWRTLDVYGKRAVEVWDNWLVFAEFHGVLDPKIDVYLDDKHEAQIL